jgi:hypothetical protein
LVEEHEHPDDAAKPDLASSYEDAFAEWDASPDAAVWDATCADGLDES